MICPVDKELMIAIEHKGVEIDYCPACEGIWLDAGELELLLQEGASAQQASLLENLRPVENCKERIYRCPRCSVRMRKVSSDVLSSVIFDACPEKDGYWFDKGELSAIISAIPSTQNQDKVVSFLRDIFHTSTHAEEETKRC